MKIIKNYWHKIALLLIMVLTGFLSFYDVGKEGYADSYYTAAVKSMLTSWHNFFFVSFDPGGFVSVDKPALGLWLQAISAWLFGLHGWSLILPEALATVISVVVLYHLVQKAFGKTTGVASALVLALTPILIAVSRTNNLDASLVTVVLLAAWALTAAAEKGSLKLLLLSMALVGLGFNIKMLQAFMVLPAFYLVYLFATAMKTGKKLLHLTIAALVLMVVSLSWAVTVDLTPADQRPYVGSSQTNSVIELALGYNGIQRITGTGNGNRIGSLDMGNGRTDATSSASLPNGNSQSGNLQPNLQALPNNGSSTDGSGSTPGNSMPDGFNGGPGGQRGQGGPGGSRGAGGPGGNGENGQKGFFRIFNQQMAGQISWLMPMALFGILILSLRMRKKEAVDKKPAARHLTLWTAWIVPMLGYFSIAGYFHRYYLSMLAPGIAALSGIGIVEMWKAYLERGLKWMILPAALTVNAVVQGFMLSRYPEWSRILIPVVCGASLVSAIVLIIIRFLNKDCLVKTIKLTVAAGFAALLIAPAIWAYTPIMYGSQTTLPMAGPELNRGSDNGGFGQGRGGMSQSPEGATSSKLINFLTQNKQNEKYLIAVSNANSAAPIILQTGEPVMDTGGFLGSDPILTADKLEKLVKNGEIRYFLLQGMGGGMGSQSEIANWVKEHGTVVSSDKWSDTASTPGNINRQDGPGQFGRGMEAGMTLYDLAPDKGTK